MFLITGIYLLVGCLFGGWFVFAGHRRLDASAAGSSLPTRLLWFPAALALWPLLLTRILAPGDAGRQETPE